MRKIWAAVFLLALLPAVGAAEWTGECVGIADGDTISVMHDGKAEKIRLYGIDCPEAKQDFGTRARAFTADMAFRRTVTVTPVDKDRYGRTVALIAVDGIPLNSALVDAGLAWVYDRYCKIPECGDWKAREEEARREGRGLWSQPDPTPPWLWRRGGGKSRSGEFHGNVKTMIFHKPSCRAYDCKQCTAAFPDREAALQAGYQPCGTCKP